MTGSSVTLRIYYLHRAPADGQPHDPWSESGQETPAHLSLHGIDLMHLHEWTPEPEGGPARRLMLVDIDAVRTTQPLDDWALKAWRAGISDLISKMINDDGSSPFVLAYTREPTWDSAVTALRIGARDIVKLSRLTERVSEYLGTKSPAGTRALSYEDLIEENSPPSSEGLPDNVVPLARKPREAPPRLKSPPIPKHAIPFPIEGLEGASPAIEAVRELVRKAAPISTPTFIHGPTGSGKELVARALHRHSDRSAGPFVVVSCGSLSRGLLESELFGHVKGAFTTAVSDHKGYIASAHGGTLVLDEVGQLPPEAQVKLLRVLQDGAVPPVGSTETVRVDVKFVATSSEDPQELVDQGLLRQDLFFRLKVIEIPLPALKERRMDIPDIARTLIRRLARRHRKPPCSLAENVVEKLLLYRWPGNVRELENTLEHALTLAWAESRSTLLLEDLPDPVRFASMATHDSDHLREAVRRFEREYVASTLRRLGGDKEQAAQVLGLSLATLYRKLS